MGAEGTLLQLDGSRHPWLEERGPELTLVGAIDDAPGSVPAAVFRDQEDAAGYLEILRTTIVDHGLPGAIYREATAPSPRRTRLRHPLADDDRRSARSAGRWSSSTSASILASSPQAKGRIERLWGTFQDRLVVELRLAGVVDRDGANAFLAGFLPRYNARFAVPALDPVAAWRACPTRSTSTGCWSSSTGARSPRTTPSRSTGGSCSCPAGRPARPTMRASGSRSTSPSTARWWPTMASADWPWRPHRSIRSSSGRPTRRGSSRTSARPRATLPWIPPRDHPWKRITPGSKLEKRLTESLGS